MEWHDLETFGISENWFVKRGGRLQKVVWTTAEKCVSSLLSVVLKCGKVYNFISFAFRRKTHHYRSRGRCLFSKLQWKLTWSRNGTGNCVNTSCMVICHEIKSAFFLTNYVVDNCSKEVIQCISIGRDCVINAPTVLCMNCGPILYK